MYKIFTGLNEYHLSEQNPSYSNIPNEIYDKVYITDSEGKLLRYNITMEDLRQLSIDQLWEIRLDVDRALEAAGEFDLEGLETTRYNNNPFVVNCKLCLNIITTYINMVENKDLEIYCE